jgi:hypothetical protein
VLGAGSAKDITQLGGVMPDIRRMAMSPMKYGSDRHIDAWARPALPLVAALAERRTAALYGPVKAASDRFDVPAIAARPLAAALAPTAGAFDLRDALTDFEMLKRAYDAYRAYPLIKQGFDRFYGPDFFAEAGRRIRDLDNDIVKRAKDSFVLPPKPRKRSRFELTLRGVDRDEGPRDKSAGLHIYRYSELLKAAGGDVDPDVAVAVNRPELTEAERTRLQNDGVLIKDKRDPVSVSIAYNTTLSMELVNPDGTGLFEVLEKPGEFDRMLVIANPHTGSGRENFSLVVRLSDPRAWLNTHRTNIWTRQNDAPTQADFCEWVDGLPSSDSLEVGGTYVALSDTGSGTCPFRVRQSYGDGVYEVSWEDYCEFGRDRPSFLPASPRRNFDRGLEGYEPWSARVRFREDASRLRSIRGELSVPRSFKVLKLKGAARPEREDIVTRCCCPTPDEQPHGSDPKPIRPGDIVDIQLMLHEKKAEAGMVDVQIRDVGAGEVWIKARGVTERMTKVAALIALVRDHGLREPQARTMLKDAAAKATMREAACYLVKYAEPFGSSLLPGPDAPMFPPPITGTEPTGYGSVSSIYPQVDFQPIPSMSSMHTDPRVYDPFYMPDQRSMRVAQEASRDGQKEVFDVSMISGLLKSVRHESLVDRYLGDLMKALDKLGRILFVFYWHSEEFEDRYGKADLPELGDSLRNAFDMLGDVTLFLREKTVQGGSGIELGNSSVPADAPDPNLAETARN